MGGFLMASARYGSRYAVNLRPLGWAVVSLVVLLALTVAWIVLRTSPARRAVAPRARDRLERGGRSDLQRRSVPPARSKLA